MVCQPAVKVKEIIQLSLHVQPLRITVMPLKTIKLGENAGEP